MQKLIKLFCTALLLFCYSFAFTQEPKLMLPVGHTGKVTSAHFSPDGNKIITTSYDKTAKIWDAATGLLLCDLKDHTSDVNSAAFSHDGTKIVTASSDSNVIIWNALTGKKIWSFRNYAGVFYPPEFHPHDSTVLCISESDNIVRLWNVITGQLVFTLNHDKSPIYSAHFSPDGKKIVTVSDSTVKIWDAQNGKYLNKIKYSFEHATFAKFSLDGKRLIISSFEGDDVCDVFTGKFLYRLNDSFSNSDKVIFSPDENKVITRGKSRFTISDAAGKLLYSIVDSSGSFNVSFSKDSKSIINVSRDGTIKLRNSGTGKLSSTFYNGSVNDLSHAEFSSDGQRIIIPIENTAAVWDIASNNLLFSLHGFTSNIISAVFSPDSKKIATALSDSTVKIWDVSTGKLSLNLNKHTGPVNSIVFNASGTKLLTASQDSTACVWDVFTGKPLLSLKNTSPVRSAIFSPDNKAIATISAEDTVGQIWDANTGKRLFYLPGMVFTNSIQFTPDGKKIIASKSYGISVWDAQSGNLIYGFEGVGDNMVSARVSPDSKEVATAYWNSETVEIQELTTGKKQLITPEGSNLASGHWLNEMLKDSSDADLFKPDEGSSYSVAFSPDGKRLVTGSRNNVARVWDITNRNSRFIGFDQAIADLQFVLKGHTSDVTITAFSPDGKKIITGSYDKTVKVWDAFTGQLLFDLKGHASDILQAEFSPDGKTIMSVSTDNTIKLWNAENGEMLYTFFAVKSEDYLVVDKNSHYDGTEAARNLLYFVCNDEIIGLDQLKDQLWVPNLAERIMHGDKINAAGLSEQDICDRTPSIRQLDKDNAQQYHYRITPRSGGLGETVLYVNGIEAKRYKPSELTKTKEGYDLIILKSKWQYLFVAGEQNKIMLKSYTIRNSISSRGLVITENAENKNKVPPHLYAVMVGVTEYKGNELDLRYAAKDATDLGKAIKSSAGKLLGDDKVHVYNLTTDKEHYSFPEKISIQQLLTDIGNKVTANDILLIFFAGHGVMNAEKNQFYFLTADASNATAINAPDKVGISMQELTEWIQPSHIKAQKRILILDACNSGQAIKDFVRFGKADQGYAVTRSDEKAAQIKAIDKLNEKSGLFILAASASDQNAYEFGRYGQGLLTYSLLETIKEQPDILEDNRYLNISRWFNASEKLVTELAKETGARQNPQIISNSNFNIGMVDDEVRAGINLANERLLFTSSRLFNNDSAILSDDLELNRLIDDKVATFFSNDINGVISFVPNSNSPDAYAVSGVYEIKSDQIKCRVNLRRNKNTKDSFEFTCKKDDTDQLAQRIADWAISRVKEYR